MWVARVVGAVGEALGADHLADVFAQRHSSLRGHVHLHATVLLQDVDGQAVFLEGSLASVPQVLHCGG